MERDKEAVLNVLKAWHEGTLVVHRQPDEMEALRALADDAMDYRRAEGVEMVPDTLTNQVAHLRAAKELQAEGKIRISRHPAGSFIIKATDN